MTKSKSAKAYFPTFDVEEIFDKKEVEGITLYRVKWQDYSMDASTWEPREHFADPTLVDEYERSVRKVDITILPASKNVSKRNITQTSNSSNEPTILHAPKRTSRRHLAKASAEVTIPSAAKRTSKRHLAQTSAKVTIPSAAKRTSKRRFAQTSVNLTISSAAKGTSKRRSTPSTDSSNEHPEPQVQKMMKNQDYEKKYSSEEISAIAGVLHNGKSVVYTTILKNEKVVFLTPDQVPSGCHTMISDVMRFTVFFGDKP
uniref:Chromo domain-containing protein n=1 Tax=Rhabditophanes sp. KR3021 TaxID=114890 RepID=A0AC35TM97_9BILA